MLTKQKSHYELEGQSMGAVGAVIGMIVGVGVATLVLIFVGVLGGQTYQLSEAKLDEIGYYASSTGLFTSNASVAQSLGHTGLVSGTLAITNVTGGGAVGLGNFTINYALGTAKYTGSIVGYNNSAMSATYDWENTTIRDYVKDGVVSGFSAMKQTADYLPLIVLAVIISIVLTLVLGFTAFGNKNGGGSAL